MKAKRLVAATLAVFLLGAAPVQAACVADDVIGQWDVYLTLPDEEIGNIAIRCPVRITHASGGSPRLPCLVGGLVGGVSAAARFTADRFCRVTGNVDLHITGQRALTLITATMSRSKDVIVGATSETVTGLTFAMQAARL